MNKLYIIGYMEVADNKEIYYKAGHHTEEMTAITGREKVGNNENKP